MPRKDFGNPENPELWECFCGNMTHLDGFFCIDPVMGIGGRVSGYRCVSPSIWKSGLSVCASCLRIIKPSVEIIGYMKREDFDTSDI